MRKLRSKLAASAAIGGAVIGGATIANAATSSSSTSSTSAATPSSTQTRPAFPAHGTAAHEDAEKPVTGAAADKARAAAVKAVGGGTAGAVTTDFTGSGYETTVTKSNGSTVEVHLDSSFRVMQGPGGRGPGAPDGHGGPGAMGAQGAPGAMGAQGSSGGYAG
ncbi:MAG: PepSY domain-containing protein [Solirubrobacteraceae bacterium]